MTEHLSAQQVERYHKRKLSAQEMIYLDDHLAVCEECRSKVIGAVKLGLSVDSLRADFESSSLTHITYEQLAAYVDDEIDSVGREIVESHLACCEQCSKEMRELMEISAGLPALTFREPPAQKPPSVWERTQSLWRLPSIRIPLQVAAAAAVIALAVWIAGLPSRKEIGELEARLAEAREKNEQLQQEYEIAKAETEDLQAQLQSASPSAQTEAAPDIALVDGPVRVRIDNQIEGLESMPAGFQQAIRSAIETGQVKTPQTVMDLAKEAEVLMGPSSGGVAFALFTPVGTVIRTARPTFRWQALEGATSYKVTVFDADYNEIARSPVLAVPSWAIPEALERGRVYLWNVTATRDGKEIKSPVAPAPEARFKVLEKNRLDEISRTRKEYPDSHLLTGLLYAEAGLLDEAEREFQILARRNPKSPIAQKLLRAIKNIKYQN